ncbi:MAG: PEP-CTERM sorting domain-containing protein [Acidobacteria bacterium]|nr:PEP-CTERM sorting domain-containing protein [Acidobacteriota bacterium]
MRTWLCLVLAFHGAAAAVSFQFEGFGAAPNLTLVQNAALTANRLRLTPALENQLGGAWYDTAVNVQGGFSTRFQFQFTERGGHTPDWEPGVSNNGADGIAFVIQNAAPAPIGLFASGIGYYGIANSLAVEFDTWHNKPSYCEPNGNHIAVNTMGTAENRPEHCQDLDGAPSNPTLGIATPAVDMSNGAIYDALINYRPGQLSVYFGNTLVPILTVNVDLATTLNLANGTDAYIGFTSSTGGAWENHDILRWSYEEVPEPHSVLLVSAGLVWLVLKRRRA